MKATRLVLLTVGLVLLGAAPARAHGLGGRTDLPVPSWLFIYGAAVAVVVSFLALAVLWKEPKLEGGGASGRRLPAVAQPVLTSRVIELLVRGISLAFFVVVVAAAAGGGPDPADNLASVTIFIWFWVGLTFAHALLGNLWATISPLDTLARTLEIGRTPRRPYPRSWGVWPAAILLLGFLWMELADPSGASPSRLFLAILIYTAITLAGMALFGRETWQRRGEAFAVLFALVARVAPFARDAEGRVTIRSPLRGLPSLDPVPGIVALVMVLIGSTTFDGLSNARFWAQWAEGLDPGPRMLANGAGLLATIGLMTGLYAVAMRAAARIAGSRWHPLAVRFVHSLVPIALAYFVAHYFSLLVLEGQLGIPVLSDPLGQGWDLIGTADYRPNIALVSANAIWYVQVAAIVLGHVAGVVLAHDRALAAFPAGRAMRTQYALLAIMVLFTVVGLSILAGA